VEGQVKKHLLVTSALVAAGVVGMSGTAVAQKKAMGPSMRVSAYANGYFGFATNDATDLGLAAGNDYNDFNVKFDSEVHFRGRVMTDNGLVIQAIMEFEGPDPAPIPARVWDEAYFRVDGSFGAFRLGQEDSVAQLMVTGYYGIWATAAGTQYDVEVGDWIIRPAGLTTDATPATATGDEGRVTYITPRMQGFQLGVSYAPTDAPSGSGDADDDKTIAIDNSNEKDLIAVAANFDQKFGATRVGVAAAWETWTSSPTAGVSPSTSDINYFSVGASVENGPFKVAAGFRTADNGAGTGEGESYQGGARYTQGANAFSVGVHYSRLEGSAALSGKDKELGVVASYARSLAPGTKVSLNGLYADYDNEAGGGADTSGFALLGVISLRF
jgi:outer membrane protein OmpU